MPDNIAEDLLAANRLDAAVKLRVQGAHWDEIARTCGYPSPAAALRAVGAAMADATLRAEMTADMLRDEANLRLDHLLREAMGLINNEQHYDADGNPVGPDSRVVTLRAIDESRRLVESKNRLNKLDKEAESSEDGTGIRIVLEQRP